MTARRSRAYLRWRPTATGPVGGLGKSLSCLLGEVAARVAEPLSGRQLELRAFALAGHGGRG